MPCLFKCVPVNPTSACPKVEMGVKIPSLMAPLPYAVVVDASVFVPDLDNRFCFATNKRPFGFWISVKYFVKRATSSAALKGAKMPPRNIKSL